MDDVKKQAEADLLLFLLTVVAGQRLQLLFLLFVVLLALSWTNHDCVGGKRWV